MSNSYLGFQSLQNTSIYFIPLENHSIPRKYRRTVSYLTDEEIGSGKVIRSFVSRSLTSYYPQRVKSFSSHVEAKSQFFWHSIRTTLLPTSVITGWTFEINSSHLSAPPYLKKLGRWGKTKTKGIFQGRTIYHSPPDIRPQMFWLLFNCSILSCLFLRFQNWIEIKTFLERLLKPALKENESVFGNSCLLKFLFFKKH